jgi:putative ABC transport system permease protein
VSFGVAATIAGNVVAGSVRKAILTSEDMRAIVGGLVEQLDTMMAFISVVIIAAAGFLIFNAFAMSVTQRRQQIGALRAVGMTRRQVMRLMLTEALIISLVGTGLGLVAGPILGRATIAVLRQFGGGLLAFVETDPTLFSIALALFLGISVTLVSMLFPARRATRISPLDALREPDPEGTHQGNSWWAWLGTGLIVALALHLIIAPPGEWVRFPTDGQLAALFVLVWLAALAVILPGFIGLIGGRVRGSLVRFLGATGRLIADNLQRGRRRVTLTILTLAFGLTVITGVTGFISFFLIDLFGTTMNAGVEADQLFVARIDVTAGWEAFTRLDLDSVLVSEEEVRGIEERVGGRGAINSNYFVIIPELSFLGDGYFSYYVSPGQIDQLRNFEDSGFQFSEGSWETAIPIMEAGCGVLVSPLVALKNGASLGGTITIDGVNGPIQCTVAGIGSGIAGASTISGVDPAALGLTNPVLVNISPYPGTDTNQLVADLEALSAEFPALVTNRVEGMAQAITDGIDVLLLTFNGLVILAVLAAALGVVNTMMISVDERRHELGLLRAVGMTKRQTQAVIMGEAALMGLIGGLLGLVAGIGLTMIVVLVYGSNSFGITIPLWPTALKSVGTALPTGLVGLIIAPLIAALAAWFPARRILQEKPVEILALQ